MNDDLQIFNKKEFVRTGLLNYHINFAHQYLNQVILAYLLDIVDKIGNFEGMDILALLIQFEENNNVYP